MLPVLCIINPTNLLHKVCTAKGALSRLMIFSNVFLILLIKFPWLAIFAEQTDKLTRGLSPTLRKAARLGMSKPALRLLSRAGIAGLGASLAIQGIGLLDD